jgi:hypothetical protein
MFATVRRYTRLAPSAVDALEDHSREVRSVLAGVPGFTEAHLIRTRDGLILVTLGEDEGTLVEAGRRFVAWADRHVPAFRLAPQAHVWAGHVLPATSAHRSFDLDAAVTLVVETEEVSAEGIGKEEGHEHA